VDTERCARTGNVDDHGMVLRRISGRFISRESTRGGFNLMENKPNYYANIPATVRYDEDLCPNAKLLYGEITALTNAEGYCWATNKYFADLYKVSKVSISKWIKQLIEKGFISSEIIYRENSKEILHRFLRIGGEGHKEKFNTPTQQKFNTPIKEKVATPPTKVNEGHKEKLSTPIKEKFKDNNTSINTTINTTSNNKKINKKGDSNTQIENEFQTFWSIYPKKRGGKENTKKSFIKARKIKKVPYETIINGLNSYIDYINSSETDEEFIVHGSTWLNQGRWEDEYLNVPKQKKIKNFMDLLDNDFRGEFTNEHERDVEIIDCDPSYLSYP
jgi:hypothetical protein